MLVKKQNFKIKINRILNIFFYSKYGSKHLWFHHSGAKEISSRKLRCCFICIETSIPGWATGNLENKTIYSF